MSTINDPRVPEHYCDALDDAVKCYCGSDAIWHKGRGHGDVDHLACANRRCGRIIPAEGRTIAEAVRLWNLEVRQDSCRPHGYMRNENGLGWRCPHCGRQFLNEG